MSRILSAFSAVVLLSCMAVSQSSAEQASGSGTSARKDEVRAVTIIRVLNTAEQSYFAKHHKFATLQQLIGSGAIEKAKTQMQGNAGDATITGDGFETYSVAINLDDAAHKYVLFAKSKQSENRSFVSDQSGVIYGTSPVR